MLRHILAAVAIIAVAAPAHAASQAAANFGAREMVEGASLSPDGKAIALIQPTAGRGSVLTIVTLGEQQQVKRVLASSGSPERLSFCRWSTGTRLICGIYVIQNEGGRPSGYTRLITLKSDGSDIKLLSARGNDRDLVVAHGGGNVIDWLGDSSGAVLMTRDYVPQFQTGNFTANGRVGLGVDRVDTATLARTTIEQPRSSAVEYISDGHGTVRIMGIQPSTSTGYAGNRIVYSYRKADSREWLPLGTLTIDGGKTSGFNPYAVDPDLNVVYGFDTKDGHDALYRIALDGSMKRELVFARPDVDVDQLVEIGRQDRVVGVSYVGEKRRTEFFDPALKAFAASLSKALPAQPLVSFVDASADENTLLLWAGSDVDPGRFYLYDKKGKTLGEVMPVRPQLAKTVLATVKPVSYPAADGTMIPAYLTLPPGSDGRNLPAIVMPHGGPGARDEWMFDWLPQFFVSRGYAVLQPNFRGSTGYGDAWFQENGFRSWRTAIGDIDDGGRWLVTQGIAAPAKLAIVGWSYGGYAALQSAVLEPGLFKAVVAVAPVTDLPAMLEREKEYADYKLLETEIGKGPHVVQGSPALNAAQIKVPVLLFHGDLDMNVAIEQSRLMNSRLKSAGGKVEFVEYKGLDHQLYDDRARTALLDKADGFLSATLGLAPAG